MILDIDSTELIYLLLGPGTILVAALLLRLDLRLQRRYEELASRVATAEAHLEALVQAEDGGQHKRQIEERVAMLSRQQEQLMLRDSETGSYFQAIRHAEKGLGVDALIERTGVTREEAELIVTLHGRPASQQASEQNRAGLEEERAGVAADGDRSAS